MHRVNILWHYLKNKVEAAGSLCVAQLFGENKMLGCLYVYLVVEVAECRLVFCKLLHKRLRKIPDP